MLAYGGSDRPVGEAHKMTAITAAVPSSNMDCKALLEQAECSYRFGKFSDAYRDCKSALEKPEFSNWKDKKKHEAVKSLIRYGFYSSGRTEVLKWLQKQKDILPDYPLHVCEWVAAETTNVSKRRLQYVRNDVIKASDQALRELLDDSSSSPRVKDMCMEILVHRVMIPHENFKEAEEALREFGPKLSPECNAELQNMVHQERTAASKAAASQTMKRAWRTVMAPVRTPSVASAPQQGPDNSTPEWLPPGTLAHRVVKGLQYLMANEYVTKYVVPAGLGLLIVWMLGPKPQPKIDPAPAADSQSDF